jgi:hypothetical protein
MTEWLLIVVLAWAGTPPATVIKIPVASQELCEKAAQQVRNDLSASAASIAVYGTTAGGFSGVATTCIQVGG